MSPISLRLVLRIVMARHQLPLLKALHAFLGVGHIWEGDPRGKMCSLIVGGVGQEVVPPRKAAQNIMQNKMQNGKSKRCKPIQVGGKQSTVDGRTSVVSKKGNKKKMNVKGQSIENTSKVTGHWAAKAIRRPDSTEIK